MPIILEEEETAVCSEVGMATAAPAPVAIFRNSRRFTSHLIGLPLSSRQYSVSALPAPDGQRLGSKRLSSRRLLGKDYGSTARADRVCNCGAGSMIHPD